jgi:hypothetical protein
MKIQQSHCSFLETLAAGKRLSYREYHRLHFHTPTRGIYLMLTALHRQLKASKLRPQNGDIPNINLLRDSDQPFLYDIRFSRKSFTLEVFDTASPNQHWSSLHPNVVILAYDISDRKTLDGLKAVRPPRE